MSGFRSLKLSLLPRQTMSGTALALCTLLTACGGGNSHSPHPTPPVQPSPPSPPPPVNLGPLYDFTPIGLPGITFGVVVRQGIANGGLVAGTSVDAAGISRAFLYNGTTSIDLGSFGGPNSRAFAVNRCGQVAGWGQTAAGIPHAFFYNGTLHDLVRLAAPSPGACRSAPAARWQAGRPYLPVRVTLSTTMAGRCATWAHSAD